jgi:S-adenosyl-L-methionine hydrolase (adenosine-forming)
VTSISFLSDYGHRDEWVGVCHGVIHGIAPAATVIDIAHDLPPADVRQAAFALENAIPFLPRDVVLAVVDPGVGTARRALALSSADGVLLVGPDNGLLWPAAQVVGGVAAAVDVSGSPFRLDPVSATFHGRDLFAPVAAHLTLGAKLEAAGEPLDPATLTRLEATPPLVGEERIDVEVRLVDRFGNVQLQARPEDIEAAGLDGAGCIGVGGRLEAQPGRTFAAAEPGTAVLYEDSSGWIAVALNAESAAERLGVRAGSSLTLSVCAR